MLTCIKPCLSCDVTLSGTLPLDYMTGVSLSLHGGLYDRTGLSLSIHGGLYDRTSVCLSLHGGLYDRTGESLSLHGGLYDRTGVSLSLHGGGGGQQDVFQCFILLAHVMI